MRTRLLRIVLAALAIGAALWTAGWYLAAGRIERQLAAWIEARRAEGMVVEHSGTRIGGFPFAWVLHVAAPVLAGAGSTGWSWQGEALEAQVAPWRLREIAVRLPGEHEVSAGGASELGGTWRVRAARPDARIVLGDQGRLDRLELDLAGAEVSRLPDASPLNIARLAGTATLRRELAGPPHRQETLSLALDLEGVSPVTPPVAALGNVVQTVELDLGFRGRLPPGRLADAVAEWRDGGGTIEIHRASVAWGPVKVTGNGTLALDAANRPLGAFTARWRGYAETVDALQATGRLRPWEATGAKILLASLARQQADGSSEIEVPLTAQDGRLYVAGLPLIRLAPLPLK